MEPEEEALLIPELSSNDVQPLKLFNKQKMVADLYNLTGDGVLAFFDEINADPQKYGIKDAETKDVFSEVVSRIKDDKKRTAVPVFLDPTMVVPFLDVKIEVTTLYDLVGWIFSIAAGKIETTANRNNYYVPLFYIYSLFCRRLTEYMTVPGKDTKLDYDPTMLQISWFKYPGSKGPTYFYIAANLDCGSASCRAVFDDDKTKLQYKRGEQLKAVGALTKDVNIKAIPHGGANLYGMCAETVPVLVIKSLMNLKGGVPFEPKYVEGLAFQGFKVLPEEPGGPAQPYKLSTVKALDGFRDPCKTCAMLLGSPQLQLDLQKFSNKF